MQQPLYNVRINLFLCLASITQNSCMVLTDTSLYMSTFDMSQYKIVKLENVFREFFT